MKRESGGVELFPSCEEMAREIKALLVSRYGIICVVLVREGDDRFVYLCVWEYGSARHFLERAEYVVHVRFRFLGRLPAGRV